MASDRKDVAKRLSPPSPFKATVCSFFGSPTVWSLLTAGISGAAEYTGDPNITTLIASVGGALSYFWAGALTPKNEADRDFFIKRIDGELEKIAANLTLSADRVTILENSNISEGKDGYYLYVQDDEINAIILKSGRETSFSLGGIHDPDNFIFRLIDWDNIDENELIIGGRLGLLLSSLIENHQYSQKEDKVEVLQDNPNLSRAHYFSGINLASASVMALQLVALVLCVFESVEYGKNSDNADQPSTGSEEELSSRYLLAASMIKMGSALSYWFLRKYEDTGKEQKDEQYRESLEDYTQSNNREKQAKIRAWTESTLIIAECKGKIDRLGQIKDLLEKELSNTASIGEKEEDPGDTYRKIEYLVGEFKRILTETSDEYDSEEVTDLANQAESNIGTFMGGYRQEYLPLAFNLAEQAMREATKSKLQGPRVMFTITSS